LEPAQNPPDHRGALDVRQVPHLTVEVAADQQDHLEGRLKRRERTAASLASPASGSTASSDGAGLGDDRNRRHYLSFSLPETVVAAVITRQMFAAIRPTL